MRHVFFLLFLFALNAPQLASAQAKTADTPHLNHAAICVKDLKRTVDFYRNVLRLEEIPNPFNDGAHAWFSIGPGLQMHVIQADARLIENKNTHLCFSVASLSSFITNLEKRNTVYTNWKGDSKNPTTRADGVKQIYLQDPDGYWIEINDAK